MLFVRSFVVAALAVGLAAAGGCKQDGGKGAPATEAVAPPVRIAPEDYVVVKRGALQTGPRISGTLEASQRAFVRAETGGTVVDTPRELGDPVKKGDLLARIESKALGDVAGSARAGVTAAQARVDLAKKEVARMEVLVKGGAVAARELDRARSELVAAQAAVTQARAQVSSSSSQLGDATVRSPITGLVAKRSVSKGDVVMMGTALYEVIDPSTMRLDASVASDDLAALAPGKSVDFAVRGYPGQKFQGTIARIAPSADPVTRQIQVLVDLPNPGNKLVAGLYAEGRVAVAQVEGLILPLAAIDLTGDQPTVLRVKDGVLERSVIAIGVRDERDEIAEVTAGVGDGDIVVLSQARKNLTAGAKVEVVPAAAAAPAPAAAPAEQK
jgi:membrane fusion protein, multidrug efflux system